RSSLSVAWFRSSHSRSSAAVAQKVGFTSARIIGGRRSRRPLTFSYLSAGLSACQLAGLLEDHACLPNQAAYVPVVTGLWADSGVVARPRRGRFEKPGDFERDGVTVIGERR